MSQPMTPQQMYAAGAVLTPFNPATGSAMIMASTANGQSSFEVRPEMLPKLQAGLDRVRTKYEEAQRLSDGLSNVAPPAWDEVTKQVTRNITQRASGGENSLFDTAQGMIDWVDEFKAAVEQAITDYQRVDEANRMA
ncbi:hypothetical protein FHX42_004416 [Saccharopolyspora lacisalsi]|uniref:PE domain-containing protein n=1 Tax=Halosaccharopolyspora lacisalsi TaxID=1000566 RepID=A0A839DYI7_9PSEU|nr:PE domain-containing protein [Halosaccharopolyspora lacisalsi]MBA8827032.1 hypothetical protein [Halosaccharopolyspora lacisalsi]